MDARVCGHPLLEGVVKLEPQAWLMSLVLSFLGYFIGWATCKSQLAAVCSKVDRLEGAVQFKATCDATHAGYSKWFENMERMQAEMRDDIRKIAAKVQG